MDKDKENIIDVNYEDITNNNFADDKDINKEPLYYSCVQVAKILEEPDSRIRYWSKVFQPLLNIPISNNVRKYTKTNIENLMFIRKLLKEDGLSIQQAFDYCSKKGFSSEEGLIDTGNPLAIKTFISAMTDEFDKKVTEMQQQIILQQQEMIEGLKQIIVENRELLIRENDILKEDLITTVDEVISERNLAIKEEISVTISDNINKFKEDFNADNKKEQEENRKLAEQTNDLLRKMLERKEEQTKDLEEKQYKSWFSKIFNKN